MKTTASSILIVLWLVCVALLPKAQAVVPPPDGGYPGFNTAEGQNALFGLTTGSANTAVGWFSLKSVTTGSFNTGVGAGTLVLNTADSNTATGAAALLLNTTGTENTANGTAALVNNSTGIRNTALGFRTLLNNIAGNDNTTVGAGALLNSTGSGNVAVGLLAGEELTTGDGNVCIGSNVTGEAGVSNTTYVRNVNTLTQNFSAGVNDYVTVRLSDGRLGHTAVVSSQRYKQDIKPLATTSETLYALKPVSFRLKKEFDATQALGFGLIAEEVEKVDSALVYRNTKGQVESVRYEMVNAMLLNEFLKEHRKVEALEANDAEQQREIKALIATVKEQAAQIQKVSAQLEVSRSAPPTVVNNQ